MYTKKIKYTDYNGNEREEEYFFHLNKSELMEMELSERGGLSTVLKRMIAAQDTPQLIKLFKELILKSYGEPSADGKRFIKSPEMSLEFSQTEAYSDLFMQLATNDIYAAEFVNGLMPSNLKQQLENTSNHSAIPAPPMK